MKVSVTTTSTSLWNLLDTEEYDMTILNKSKITESNSTNSYWVYIENIWTESIYFENIFDAVIWESKEVEAWWSFAIDVKTITGLKFICAADTVDAIIIIT